MNCELSTGLWNRCPPINAGGGPDRCSVVGAQHAAPLLGKTVAPRRVASHSEIFAKNVGLYRGRAYARARVDGEDCGFGFAADFNFRMEEFGQRFDARDEARAATRKVAGGLQRVAAPVPS